MNNEKRNQPYENPKQVYKVQVKKPTLVNARRQRKTKQQRYEDIWKHAVKLQLQHLLPAMEVRFCLKPFPDTVTDESNLQRLPVRVDF